MPSPETLAHFYVVTHDYLSASDVDGVKVDAQAVIGALGYKNGGGPAFARRVHAALEESVRAHFPDNGIINCMCHSTENIYNFKSSALARASDDFYPANEASHTVHIANVVYNSIFMGEIVLPDWDMFQSQHVAGALHAATRAIGGCPVYVSDHPGKHDFEILHQLVFPSGSVLRCRRAGRPTRDCLFRDVTRDGTNGAQGVEPQLCELSDRRCSTFKAPRGRAPRISSRVCRNQSPPRSRNCVHETLKASPIDRRRAHRLWSVRIATGALKCCA